VDDIKPLAFLEYANLILEGAWKTDFQIDPWQCRVRVEQAIGKDHADELFRRLDEDQEKGGA
jgi:hypothetical protein